MVFGAKLAMAEQTDSERMGAEMMNPGNTLTCMDQARGGEFRVLVYGNSIARHTPWPKIGWTNDWGMAASAPEKDFAHLVAAGLEDRLGKKGDLRVRNMAPLERSFTNDTSRMMAAERSADVAWAPDYVVIAVGENSPVVTDANSHLYVKFLADLARPFATLPKRPKIVMRSPFFYNKRKAELTERAAKEVGAVYVDVGELGKKDENKAIGLFWHKGVANHPCDLGMKRLADLILAGFDSIDAHGELSLKSPDGRICVGFGADASGMSWNLSRDGRLLVKPSRLGLEFAAGSPNEKGAESLSEMKVVDVRRSQSDTIWTTRLSRRGKIRDHYNEMTVDLVETEARLPRIGLGQTSFVKIPRRISIVFRAYDEGAAFRYVVPEQEVFDGFQLTEELTQWRFTGDPVTWTTRYRRPTGGEESQFVKSPVSGIDAKTCLGLPVIVETEGSTVALCEAALVNWSALFFRAGKSSDGDAVLSAELAKLPRTPASTMNVAVIRETPASSPWRVAIVGDDEIDLLRKNDIIQNLNPPPDEKIDFGWVRPGASSWDWWVESNNSLSTELTLKLVDFAAEMGWPYHTIDGGWYGFARRPNHGPAVDLRPRKDFDLARIVAHAKKKGVAIWVWVHWMELDDVGLEESFSRLEKWGVAGVKTDFLERADQWMVNWCERAARIAARHHICLNLHGSFRPTGVERTWPNLLTREAVLGNEMSIFFADRITIKHCLTLPFTRFLLGPGDFTPGGFGNVYSRDFVPQVEKGHRYGDETDRCPHWAEQQGTRAFSLAQCVAYDSPLTTLCDWPERYRGAAGVEALRELPTTWKDTIPLEGKCGEYYSVLRQAHDGRFYYAAMTVDRRSIELPLDFLGEGEWNVVTYADDLKRTPADAKALSVIGRRVRKGDRLRFDLCGEGGVLAVFSKATPPAKQ